MDDVSVSTTAITAEQESACPCCGRPVYEGEGVLESDSRELAHYGYRWAEGHESRFTIGICALDEHGGNVAGLAVVSGRGDGEQLIYTVLDPEQAPWGGSASLGKVLTRKELLEDGVIPDLFSLLDAIVANEPRISSRILGGTALE
ncbi:hypothetical protein [Massilia sp. CT11-137]|uniref:hypothetical protein n=1 Tax=Massilia sp. CT11-137 TaxID=3393901 RepID=UPI0039AF4DAF